jgi:hypothetical protein
MDNFSKTINNMIKEVDLVSNITTSSVKIAKKLITRKQNSIHMLKKAIEDEIKNKNRSTILNLLKTEIDKKYGSSKNKGGQLTNQNAKGSKGPTGRKNALKPENETKKYTLPNAKINKSFHLEIESFLTDNKKFKSKSSLIIAGVKKIIEMKGEQNE